MGFHVFFHSTYEHYSEWVFSGMLPNGGRGAKSPLPTICHTYSRILKWWNLAQFCLYLKKIQKIYKSCKTPLEFWWHFFNGNQQLLSYQEIQIQILKGCFNKHGCNFIKCQQHLATLGLFRINVFWNTGYYVILSHIFYIRLLHNFCPWSHQQSFIMWRLIL